MTTISAAEFKALKPKKENKYRNKPVVIDGITFQSTKEGNYYLHLKLLVKAGEVAKFTMQNNYPLIVNGVLIRHYRDDFTVYYTDGRIEVIDTKGFLTEVYKIKKRLMKAIYGIEIIEK